MKGELFVKKKYESLLIEVISFEKNDVITASATVPTTTPTTTAASGAENQVGQAGGDGSGIDWGA